MSSHHFVKEGQEPALFILEAFSLEAVEPLLEWAPLVVVSDTILDDVLRWGIKIDVVVVKKENVDELHGQLSDQGPVQFLTYTHNQTSTVLEFLVDKKQSAVTIVSNSASAVLQASVVFGNKLNISILTAAIRWSYIAVAHFTKWFPAGSTVLIKSPSPIEYSGRPLTTDRIVAEGDGIISLKSSEGFWVGEPVL